MIAQSDILGDNGTYEIRETIARSFGMSGDKRLEIITTIDFGSESSHARFLVSDHTHEYEFELNEVDLAVNKYNAAR